MKNKKITPITRINKWFSEEDFGLEVSMGREALEGDGNFTVILYRVNRQTTEYDSLYGEATTDGIRFLPPTELKVYPTLDKPENKTYNSNGTVRYLQDGQLSFVIYDAQLTELNVNISFGDYIGYPVSENIIRFFTVVNDGTINFDNEHTIMGYKAAGKTIVCAPVDETEFRGF